MRLVICMKIIEYDTARKIEYFNLHDFVERIKVSPFVLEHMEEINKEFDEYFKKLSELDDKFVLYFLTSLARDEISNNQKVENHKIKDFDFSMGNLFFDSLEVDHDRIHELHKFVMKDDEFKEKHGIYRKNPARVSKVQDGVEEVYWYGVEPEDINKFMDDFIEVYKSRKPSVLDSNPFIKASLIHLLLAKIQPYFDGNRRTARTLHNIKFTEIINEIYDMDLKICPINLSESISLNILSYIKVLNNTYFDLEHDNKEIINYWFNLMLNMYEEQLYRNKYIIDNMDEHVQKILEIKDITDPKIVKEIENLDYRVARVIEMKEKMEPDTREKVEHMKIRKLKK